MTNPPFEHSRVGFSLNLKSLNKLAKLLIESVNQFRIDYIVEITQQEYLD